MAWRKFTKNDLASVLSQHEIDAYSASVADGTQADPVEGLITDTTAMIRGYIAKDPSVRLNSDKSTLPPEVFAHAKHFIAFDVVARFPVSNTEERRLARESAEKFFKNLPAVEQGEPPPPFGKSSVIVVGEEAKIALTGSNLI